MSLVKQCDHCKRITSRKESTWIVVRVQNGTRQGFLGGDAPAYDDCDYCSWKCVADHASLRAHEDDLARPTTPSSDHYSQ